LTDKFLRGGTASGTSYANPTTGNTQSVSIGTGNLPNHTHTVTDAGHYHNIKVWSRDGDSGTGGSWTNTGDTIYKTETAYTGIRVDGGGSASPTALTINTMPSYYTVIYIMKVA
jgi:hypothetical protein